ncbi:MAG TPA: hypothetical protein VEK07_13850 [Polyangiaceae bacterium]|nr:hypothetical protein [Polyangiaceae bacterium]
MSIAREGIGLELAQATPIGCLRVIALASTFAGVRFPVNVSGGVSRFRHRRARLERLELELSSRALERWAAPRLRDAGWHQTPDVWVAFDSAEKASLCVSTVLPADDDRIRPGPAVAFDLHILPDRDDLMLIVSNARGFDLPAPATAIAVACVEAAIGARATRSGTSFTFHRYVTMLAREVLPPAGARVPAADGVESALRLVDHDTWLVSATRNGQAPAPADSTLRAREAAALSSEADDALVAGDLTGARAAYLTALERAPRHPEITRRVIEIDAWTSGRAEAALAMLAEVTPPNAGPLEIVRGELLRETGDVEGSVLSFENAGEREPAPAVAALAYERAARWTLDPERARQSLDRALARAPRATPARWARVRAHLAAGRVREAFADVEHLDAMAGGAAAKSAVWMCAGRTWQALGLHGGARTLFERALRFVPDDPHALAGLAGALLSEGSATRSVSLLTRALSMASNRDSSSAIGLDLARALAEHLHDLPAAIARATAIPEDAPQAPVARGLEGRWRASLGDAAGASLAYSRLRELAESLVPEMEPPQAPALSLASSSSGGGLPLQEIADLLREAAHWELSERNDTIAAERHLAAAARLRPHDDASRRTLHDVRSRASPSTDAVRAEQPDLEDAEPPSFAGDVPSFAGGLPPLDELDSAGSADAGALDIQRAARVEDLSRRLQANPADEAVADELAILLEQVGRGHELLALLIARLDDASAERRVALLPRVRTTLERLATAAQANGRADEAALYRDTALRLDESP